MKPGCALMLVLVCMVVENLRVDAQAPGSAGAVRPVSPARPGLEPIAMPPLDDVEPAVAAHVTEARTSLERVAARADAGARAVADAYGALARVLHAYELFEPAESAYRNASRLSPGDGRWPHLLGFLYQQTGRLEDAAAAFERARRAQPGDRALVVHLADVYLGLNRLREAREQFEFVIDVFPAVAQQGLGEVALRERRFADAVEHFQSALDRAPHATSLYYSLAMAYRGLGRMDQARSHLDQRGPGTVRAADALVDDLQDLVRGERALVMRGRRLYYGGEYGRAADAFRRALEAAPSSVTARINLGLSLLQLGAVKEASEQFTTALQLEPANHEAQTGLGIALARQGRDGDAVPHLRAAYAADPDAAGVTSELVGALLRLGQDNEAIALMTERSSRYPDEEPTTVSLSILLARHERFGDAIRLLGEAHERSPDRRPTATTLARLLASSPDRTLRDGARALLLAQAVYAAEPSPAYGETVALALAEMGRCSDAAEWMRRAVNEAERLKNADEAGRLRDELPKYQGTSCRP